MPFYTRLRGDNPDGLRTIEGLLRLKEALRVSGMSQRRVDGNLVLATWNIRELGKGKMGDRRPECLHYIAEIMDHFDLVAVQEVREDMREVDELKRNLGWWWRLLVTDVTAGRSGNKERLAFFYDSRKINFGGLAGEIVLPPLTTKKKVTPAEQLARTPYVVGFQAGWLRFVICTAHIYYGQSKPDDPRRVREIASLADFLAKEASKKEAWAPTTILLGDFNIFSTEDKAYQAIGEAGFTIPPQLMALPSNMKRNRHYDQIAFFGSSRRANVSLLNAGVFDFYKTVYREEDEGAYREAMGPGYKADKKGKRRTAEKRSTYYKQWRTFQMSDHLPLWVELHTDFSEKYLSSKLPG